MNIDLYNDDCLEVMDDLIKQGVKVDAIITDPPYGTTACSWDSVIPFNNYISEKKDKILTKRGGGSSSGLKLFQYCLFIGKKAFNTFLFFEVLDG